MSLSQSDVPEAEEMHIEDAVERAIWEPMHEWESRIKFVEDNIARHGLEKALQLSIVWGNMKFLGCRYPDKTEALVSYYPLPTPDELIESRKRRPPKRSLDVDKPPDAKKPAPSRQEVSNLISSIRSQTEQIPPGKHDLVESIAKNLCMCEKCNGKQDSSMSKAHRVLERHNTMFGEPVEVTFREAAEDRVCVLAYCGEVAMEMVASSEKDAESAVCKELLKRVEDWQESNQFPPCKFTAASSYSSPSHYTPPPSHNHYSPSPSGPYNSSSNVHHQPRYPPPHNYGSSSRGGNTYHPPESHSQYGQGGNPQYGQGGNSQYGQGGNSQYGQGGSSQYGQGGSSQYGQGGSSQYRQGGNSQYGQGGNYYMPPRPSNHGNRGGYNRDGYYGQ